MGEEINCREEKITKKYKDYEFGKESFLVESPGIVSEYKYAGVTRIKETDEFFMIFKSRLTIIPVEKAGLEDGNVDGFREFLEETCGLAVEKTAAMA